MDQVRLGPGLVLVAALALVRLRVVGRWPQTGQSMAYTPRATAAARSCTSSRLHSTSVCTSSPCEGTTPPGRGRRGTGNPFSELRTEPAPSAYPTAALPEPRKGFQHPAGRLRRASDVGLPAPRPPSGTRRRTSDTGAANRQAERLTQRRRMTSAKPNNPRNSQPKAKPRPTAHGPFPI